MHQKVLVNNAIGLSHIFNFSINNFNVSYLINKIAITNMWFQKKYDKIHFKFQQIDNFKLENQKIN